MRTGERSADTTRWTLSDGTGRGRRIRFLTLAWLLTAVALPSNGRAQEVSPDDPTAPVYRVPSPELEALVDAPLTPATSVGPAGQTMVLMEVPGLLTIDDLSQPELRLAGLRLNPRTNGPSRARYFTSLTLSRLADGRQTPVTGLPEEPRIGSVRWSPDGARLAFTLTRENGIELWVADVATGEARALTDARLVVLPQSAAFEWLPDGRTLVARLVPSERGTPPPAVDVPSGPVIQENVGRVAPARTYQDLLTDPHDEALFEHYLTAQVALIELDGAIREVGPTGLIAGAEPSPDGRFLLVSTIHRPFSYLVPANRFPIRTEVWDLEGRVVAEIADLPLAEEVPVGFGAVRTGRRSISWRADAPSTLYWVEALDGGDPWKEAEVRDQVFTLGEPFDGDPAPLASLGLRYSGVQWGHDDLALVTSLWFRTRMMRAWVVQPGTPGAEPRLLFERSLEDRYNDPGRPLMRSTAAGTSVLLTAEEGNTLFLVGQGASPEGNRPFLDRFDVASGETERLWRSEAPYYESPVELLDMDQGVVLTRREAVDEPPNYFVRNLATGGVRQLTDFPHPTPDLAGVEKELIQYEREDGVQLSATLYLPPGYEPEDGPIPTLMWAYPREFKNADLAGQLTDSPYRFVRVSYWGALPMLTQGWAVLDNPTLPIIGEGDEEPNDTYVEQLVAGARAAVNLVVDRGVADPDRIAIGGHSYGAFMSANLLAHSDLFRAGIARSGAYNRTLTPFGFQLEERTFWEAPEIYFSMSPFMHADEVDEPLLMIHGDADNNSGTFPLQSRRFYHALKGHGATVRLVMLPHESHGYRARESILHMLWEENEWLKRHVEDAAPRPAATVSEAGQ
jgi:dipeptidyl aminopeptidase/acylaminoacyl peptidase